MPVTVTISGENMEFEREVSEHTAIEIMELAIDGAGSGEEAADEPGEFGALPAKFFTRLSPKQEALVRVLLDADEPITSTELRRRMNDEYGAEVESGRALAGILGGFTRRYGDDFDLVRVEWGDGEGLYRLNPDRPEYVVEIEDRY